nr:MAG TPA: Ogr/Delta-like zinc finger protein [Bacteriophage sp.]
MKCPLCKIEAAIAESRYVVSEEKPPRLFIEQDMKCRNPQCSNYKKIIVTVRNELPVSKEPNEN